ncbi:MAG: hypothetical protein FWF14_04375 [Streptococcaceae bacterium]|nr:hypothetical protein [Streptococcaceae bacterium]
MDRMAYSFIVFVSIYIILFYLAFLCWAVQGIVEFIKDFRIVRKLEKYESNEEESKVTEYSKNRYKKKFLERDE